MSSTLNQTRAPAALGGFVFVAFEFICIALEGGETPARDASAATVVRYLHDHATAVKASQVLAAFGVAALLWWAAGVWRTLRAESEAVATAAVAALGVGLALVLVDVSIFSTAALTVDRLSGDAIEILYELSTAAILLSGAGVAVFLVAACGLNSAGELFPRWTNYLGWLGAALFGVGLVGVGTTSGIVVNASYTAVAVWFLWLVAVSVSMWRRPAPTDIELDERSPSPGARGGR